MTWINTNLATILAAWAVLGIVTGAVAPLLPVGIVRTVLLVLSHISPANLSAAWQTLTAWQTNPVEREASRLNSRGFISIGAMFAMLCTGVAVLACAVWLSGCAQVQAAFPELQAVEQVVAADLEAGDSDSQIAADVCKALGGTASTDAVCADVETVVQDVVSVLIDAKVLGAKGNAAAAGYMDRAAAKHLAKAKAALQ